jgi:hypothetical protein
VTANVACAGSRGPGAAGRHDPICCIPAPAKAAGSLLALAFVRVSYRFGGKEGKHQRQKKINCWRLHGYGCVPRIDLPTQSASSSLLSVSPPGRSTALSVASLPPAPTLPMQGPGGHDSIYCIPAPAKAAGSLLALASAKVKV